MAGLSPQVYVPSSAAPQSHRCPCSYISTLQAHILTLTCVQDESRHHSILHASVEEDPL
jgi:hypothetical protein